jgi:hypothetical protein
VILVQSQSLVPFGEERLILEAPAFCYVEQVCAQIAIAIAG